MKRWKSLTAALCAAVLLCGFSVPSYAYADGGAGSDYGDPTMETPAPAPEPTIEPGQGFSEEGGFVTAEVEDEGRGIPEEEQSRIFESFYQVDKVRNRKNNGVGLGLSLCADIAGIHEAEIKLASRVGKGTLMTIRFPCYKEVTKAM